MTTQLLDCVEVQPPTEADAAIIWLHGLGADGHDFPPIVPQLGLPSGHGLRFVFPHAAPIPVTVNGGMVMPAWYDILGMDFERRVDEAGVRASAERVEHLVRRERERGIPSERILLAGFSQGGAIALHLGLRLEQALGGIVALELRGEPGDEGYHSSLGPRLKAGCRQGDVLLRPLGNVLYALPPACVSEEEAGRIAAAMRRVALGALKGSSRF